VSLADVINEARAAQPITKLIRQNFTRSDNVPPLQPGDWLRASGLSDLCPRAEVLCSVHKVTRDVHFSADSLVTFLHGSALHWAFQNRLLPAVGAFLGRWKCLGCGKGYGGPDEDAAGESRALTGALTLGLVRRPEVCPQCGGKEFLYREIWFGDEVLKVGGHPDGFLQTPGMVGLGVFEGKSIHERFFWEVKNVPMLGHAIQVQTYLWLTDLQWGKIIYWSKGGSGVTSLKEHLIERDEEAINSVKRMVRSIRSGIVSGELPAKICGNKLCKRAKSCAVVEQCFAGSAPRKGSDTPSEDHPF